MELQPRLGDDQRLVFLHLPKVGGRSVNHLLRRKFGQGFCPLREWREIVEHRAELSPYRVLRGHIFAAITDFLEVNTATMAFFRDPVDRAISEYRFIRRTPRHVRHELVRNQSFEEFINTGRNLTVYARFLGYEPVNGDYQTMRPCKDDQALLAQAKARVDALGFVGITEEFDADFRRLEDWLGAPPGNDVPAVNVAPTSETLEVSAAVRERTAEIAWIDCEIYDYVCQVRKQRIAATAAG